MRKILFWLAMVQISVSPLFAVELIKDGKLQFKGIALHAKATPAARYAAREISYHIEQATGEKLPIIGTGEVKGGERYFFIGHCQKNLYLKAWKLPNDSGVIHITPKAIHIAGRDGRYEVGKSNNSLGTLFAAYEFLEKYLGVRWLWPGKYGEIIPKHRNLTLTEGKVVVRAKLLSSGWRGACAGSYKEAWRSEENRRRFFKDQGIWLRRHRFNAYSNFYHGHAFTDYYAKYKKSHPEFFNLLPDGTRRPSAFSWNGGIPKYISMCVSSPELVKHIVKKWSQGNRRRMLNLNENDTSGKCVCPNCLKWDNSPIPDQQRFAAAKRLFDLGMAQKKAGKKVSRESSAWQKELGSLSDRYCYFYLAAQKEADKIDPNHMIMGLIYANYSQPPTDRIKLNERIVLRFCPPFMYPWTEQKVRDYKKIWGGWAKTGARLMFRPNFTHDGHHFPVQYHEVFYDLYTFSAKNGMIAVDMDSLTGHYATQGLVNYVIATLNHNRDVPLAQLEDEFYSAFGAAKEKVKEYFQYVTQVSMKSGFKDPFKGNTNEGGYLWVDLFRVADRLFTPQVMARCTAILDAAAKTPGLDPVSLERVKMLQYGVENAKLTMAAQALFRKYQAKKCSIKEFDAAVVKLDAYRASIEHTNALNMSHIRRLENRHWRTRLPMTRHKKR